MILQANPVNKAKDVTWIDSETELSDLLEKGKLTGPLDTLEIQRFDIFFRYALHRCHKDAERTARKKGFDVVYCEGNTRFFEFPQS